MTNPIILTMGRVVSQFLSGTQKAAHRRADGSVLTAALLSQVRWCSLQTAIENACLVCQSANK